MVDFNSLDYLIYLSSLYICTCDYCVTPVPIGLGFGFWTALGLGLRGPDLGLGLDNKLHDEMLKLV